MQAVPTKIAAAKDCHVARFASLLAMTNLAVCTAPLPSPWERVARRSRDGCGSAGSSDKSCSCFGLPRSLRSLAMTNLVLQFLRCHCEASEKPWQSQGSADKERSYQRLPRRVSCETLLAMTTRMVCTALVAPLEGSCHFCLQK